MQLTLEAGIVVNTAGHADGLLSSEDGLLAAGAGIRHGGLGEQKCPLECKP